jgi:hypothetical protein
MMLLIKDIKCYPIAVKYFSGKKNGAREVNTSFYKDFYETANTIFDKLCYFI